MSSKVIKGLTVEIGGDTTKLGKALEDVEKKSRSLSSELGSINKLLKMDPGNTDLLAQKQKVLAEAVTTTKEKLDKLKESEKQVQAQFEKGEASEEQVRALQREIIATTKKLDSYEQAAKETAEALDKLGDNTDKATEDVEDLGKKADKAEKSSGDLGDTLDGPLSTGLKAVASLAVAATGAIIGATEATQEYRTEMGKLNTAFEDSGFSGEAATKTYKELQSILGETDQAVEASNMLAKLCDNEEDLAEWTDVLTGVYATFGASLPVEALAESANESARTGQIAGNLADALNWAAEEGETFGVTMKAATKENEEWNKAVEEAASAEDYFNLALQECNSTQERQQLITKTLTRLYGNAATEYKKTNKAVIEANKANEEWTATLAEIGEEVQPVNTDIKKMGVEILKSAKEPLKDTAEYIRGTVIPAITSISKWVLSNGPVIKGTLVGVTSALVAYEVATFAATVTQEGLKGAIMATTVAQKALTLAQAATPWGLVATAVTALVGGLIAYNVAMENSKERVDALTAEERELMTAANETAEAFRNQQAETANTSAGITAQMGHVQKLATELQNLASSSGKVKEEDQARAQFILNELNSALGTEYTMTDGVVQKYGELKKNIDAVIQSKTANALLEANNADYVAAIQAEDEALKNVVLAEKDYQSQLVAAQEAEAAHAEAYAAYQEKLANCKTSADYRALQSEAMKVDGLRIKKEEEQALLDEKEAAYTKAAEDYGNYSNTISNYEAAQQAALEGNYTKAVELLKKKGGNFGEYADEVDQATRDAVDALYKEAVDAGIAAARTKTNFENGVKGYTEDMVKESEQAYEDALGAWADARIAAESVGKDMSGGLEKGMDSKKSSLLKKAKSIVTSIISAMRKEADSHSPSRKMIDFGEDMGEGAAIGMENKSDRIDDVARDQVDGILDTYSDAGGTTGQSVFNSIKSQDRAQSNQAQSALSAAYGDKLDRILAAIERGQILTLDGDAVVGGTASRMNNKLGQLRVLAERGAM